MKDYGKCIVRITPNLEKGLCEKEFQALQACMRTVVFVLLFADLHAAVTSHGVQYATSLLVASNHCQVILMCS